jgi:hypothetical protein
MIKFLTLLVLAFIAQQPISNEPAVWAEPIPLFTDQIQEHYSGPATQYAAGHRGIDIKIAPNQTLKSPVAGRIAFADLVVDRMVVTIESEGKKLSFEPACTDLEVGDPIRAGQEFAWHCAPEADYQYHCESCVHFSARTKFGYLSPMYFYGTLSPSSLSA